MNDQQPLDNQNPDSPPETIETVLAEQGKDINFPGAIAGGLMGGALGALIWWGVVVVTNYQIGLIAIVIGWAAGQGVHILSGRKRALSLQIISVAITAVSYSMASYWVSRTFILKYAAENSVEAALPLFPDPSLLFDVVSSGMEMLDLLFVAIALWQAWKMPAQLVVRSSEAPQDQV